MQLLHAVRAHSLDGQPALLERRFQKQDRDNRRLAQFSTELFDPDRMHGLEVLRFQGPKQGVVSPARCNAEKACRQW